MPRGVMSRVLVMPNLKPPVVTTAQALEYRERILAAKPDDLDITPLMTLYLTDKTPPEEIDAAVDSGAIAAVKLYPAGATTNSNSGVTDYKLVVPALQRMAARGLPLCIHGEVTDASIDFFEREAEFVRTKLPYIVSAAPGLKIVLEHITTRASAEFVRSAGGNVAATITPQHLLFNRNALFDGGLRPHMYCLPILKTEDDRLALLEAIQSGSEQFFLGTDSAPHARGNKESDCGCAGIFSAHNSLEVYAMAFELAGCLENLPAFASANGAKFYGLEPNDPAKTVRVERRGVEVPAELSFGSSVVVPFLAGTTVTWSTVPHAE
jgi:dihydroorotase